MSQSYWELLKDPRWQKLRLEILERDEWRCNECGDDSTELHVHHLFYVKGRKPWEYDKDELRSLCKPCHEAATELAWKVSVAAGVQHERGLEQVLGYCRGLLLSQKELPWLKVSYNDAKGIADVYGLSREQVWEFAVAHQFKVTDADLTSMHTQSQMLGLEVNGWNG